MNGLAERHEDMNQGHKNADSGGWSLYLSIPDSWNAISRSAIAVNCVCFTVWHLCRKLYNKVGKFQQPANGVWHLFYSPKHIFTRIWQVAGANFKPCLHSPWVLLWTRSEMRKDLFVFYSKKNSISILGGGWKKILSSRGMTKNNWEPLL